jgi:hypothetical protein
MRMCVRVRGRVAVGGVVAAANVTALNTDPQVQPGFSCGQAFLASPDPFGEAGELDVVAVTALHRDDDATDAFRPHPTNARSPTAHTSSAKGWLGEMHLRAGESGSRPPHGEPARRQIRVACRALGQGGTRAPSRPCVAGRILVRSRCAGRGRRAGLAGRQGSCWGAWLGLDGWDRSAVDDVFGSCDCRGAVGDQEGDEFGDVLGLRGSAERDPAE